MIKTLCLLKLFNDYYRSKMANSLMYTPANVILAHSNFMYGGKKSLHETFLSSL